MTERTIKYPDGLTEVDLMLYADGMVDEAERNRIEALLREHPALMREVDQFTQSRKAVEGHFADALMKEVPARFLEAMDSATPQEKVVDFSAERHVRRGFWQQPQWQAMAASVFLAVGGVLGWGLSQMTTGDLAPQGQPTLMVAGALAPQNPFAQALEQASSAETIAINDGQFHTIQTFLTADSRACREFEYAPATGGAVVGVACRTEDAWQVEAVLAAAPGGNAQDNFVLASGFDDEALEAVLFGLGAQSPLGAQAEACVVNAQWQNLQNCVE